MLIPEQTRELLVAIASGASETILAIRFEEWYLVSKRFSLCMLTLGTYADRPSLRNHGFSTPLRKLVRDLQ
jgi:hypothetical protein